MDTDKISSLVALAAAPLVKVEAGFKDGLPVTAAQVSDAWNSILAKLQLANENGWLVADSYRQAFQQGSSRLNGLELVLASKVAALAQDAQQNGYQQIQGVGTAFVTSRSACRSCPGIKKLAKIFVVAKA